MKIRSEVWTHALVETRSGGSITHDDVRVELGVSAETEDDEVIKDVLGEMCKHGWLTEMNGEYHGATPQLGPSICTPRY